MITVILIIFFHGFRFLVSIGNLLCQPHERHVRITLPRYILTLPVYPGIRYDLHSLQYRLLRCEGILIRSFVAILVACNTHWLL